MDILRPDQCRNRCDMAIGFKACARWLLVRYAGCSRHVNDTLNVLCVWRRHHDTSRDDWERRALRVNNQFRNKSFFGVMHNQRSTLLVRSSPKTHEQLHHVKVINSIAMCNQLTGDVSLDSINNKKPMHCTALHGKATQSLNSTKTNVPKVCD